MTINSRHKLGIRKELILKDRPISVSFSVVLQPSPINCSGNSIQQTREIEGLGLNQLYLARLQ